MTMLPGQPPFELYQQTDSVDMDSAPGLSHTGPMAGDSDSMEMDSRPLEDHQIHIQAHRMQLQAEQNRRQQQQEHQGHQTQQRLTEQRQIPQQQEYSALRQHPSVPRSVQQQEQQRHHWHSLAPTTETSYETDMPSLSYSEDHSTSSIASSQTGTQMAPRQGHVQYFQGPGMETDRPGLGVGNVWMQAGAAGLDGPDQDHEYFFASVPNTTAPNVTPLAYMEVDEFLNVKTLTKGGNGEIQQAYWPAKKTLVILKSLLSTKYSVAKLTAMFDKEVEVMHRCGDHDNIVKFYGIATRKQYPQDLEGQGQQPQMRFERHMVMSYYEHGDLTNLISPRSRSTPPLPVNLVDKLYLAMDIALGLEHLLRCGFHHGDLHPKNILIDDRTSLHGRPHGEVGRYQARLTDFGLRRIRDYKNQVSSQQFGGVWQFMAPERMCRDVDRPRYNLACDIFALGVIYWFMMAGRYPFKDPSAYTPGAREGRIDGTPDWYYAVYDQAWSENPKERQQDLQEIIRVFQLNLGIPTTQQSPVSPMPQHLLGQTPYMSPPYSHDSPTYAPSLTTFEGTRAHNIYPSAVGTPRGGSSMMTPTIVALSAFYGDAAGSHLPSPGPSTATSTSTSSSTRSLNPNHPRNKKATVPNGMQSRILQRPR
ncbi:hypothetical protein EMPS_09686 [Entomortierella parvispora]|uniref:Protein kinase domain-containing protein n=1 Tax=Entomortierella parvispora TaxID=205924 RepID=A0A9P3HJA8_9FUNG|nr:hypothetical protein EMPS_09686 [Entomortierella parvispora]